MTSSILPDVDTARALLREIGIIAGPEQVVPMPGGTINTTFRIAQGKESPLYLRIAPDDDEVEAGPGWLSAHGLRREAAAIGMLDAISELLPRTVHADWSRELINRDWVLQTEVPGRPWSEIDEDLTPDEHTSLWRQLGSITRQIHSVVGSEFGPPEDGFGHGTWSDLVRWDVTGFRVDAHRFGIDEDPFRRLTAMVNEAVHILDKVTEPRLIHSDLHPRHLFVRRNEAGDVHISGIIDLEFARFADPYSESIFVMDALAGNSDPGMAAFCEAYGCELPDRSFGLRSVIYQLTALGWVVMDLHRKGQRDAIPEVLARMTALLDRAENAM